MPARGAFSYPESLYATLYARACALVRTVTSREPLRQGGLCEEVVAELGAAMTCDVLQVQSELPPRELCGELAQGSKADSRAIVTAASLASKATDYLRGFSQPNEQAA